MEILVEVVDEDKRNRLKMKNVSEQDGKLIIERFFQTVGVTHSESIETTPIATIQSKPFSAKKIGSLDTEEKRDTSQEKVNPISRVEAPKPRPKSLPLLGLGERSHTPLSEFVSITKPDEETQEADEERPEHWDTGIKKDANGKERYRCRYWCQCGNRGRRYIYARTPTIRCHNCEMELNVKPATDIINNGVPDRDELGNFYLARI